MRPKFDTYQMILLIGCMGSKDEAVNRIVFPLRSEID